MPRGPTVHLALSTPPPASLPPTRPPSHVSPSCLPGSRGHCHSHAPCVHTRLASTRAGHKPACVPGLPAHSCFCTHTLGQLQHTLGPAPGAPAPCLEGGPRWGDRVGPGAAAANSRPLGAAARDPGCSPLPRAVGGMMCYHVKL